MLDPEAEAAELLRPFDRMPSARGLVEHHLGPDPIIRAPRIVGGGDAELVWLRGRPLVAIRSRLSREAFRWALLHELAEWHLQRLDYHEADVEAQAEALTAALVMPREDFRREYWAASERFAAVARYFFTTETAVALRLGEVERRPVVVVAPTHLRARGPDEWVWPPEPEIRRMAKARRLPRGLARVALTDDKRRRALLAETA